MIYSNPSARTQWTLLSCLNAAAQHHLLEITQEMRKRAINIIITCNGVSAIFYLRSTFINYFSVGAGGVWARVGGNINLPSPAMLLCGSLLPSSLSSSEHYNNIAADQWPLFRRGWPRGRGRWSDHCDQAPGPGDNLLLGDPLSGVRGEARGGRDQGGGGQGHHPLWWHR